MEDIDLIVALGEANEKWPKFPAKARVEHWPIPDPQRAAGKETSSGQMLFRYIRDEIDKKVAALFLDYWRNLAH